VFILDCHGQVVAGTRLDRIHYNYTYYRYAKGGRNDGINRQVKNRAFNRYSGPGVLNLSKPEATFTLSY
jgi:hypothetical protein